MHHSSRSTGLVTVYNITKDRLETCLRTDFRKNRQRAYTVADTARLVNRHRKYFPTLIKNGLDLICVATHYSNRYENSDNYLNAKADEELKNYAYYLKNVPQQEIISNFCNKIFIMPLISVLKFSANNLNILIDCILYFLLKYSYSTSEILFTVILFH